MRSITNLPTPSSGKSVSCTDTSPTGSGEMSRNPSCTLDLSELAPWKLEKLQQDARALADVLASFSWMKCRRSAKQRKSDRERLTRQIVDFSIQLMKELE